MKPAKPERAVDPTRKMLRQSMAWIHTWLGLLAGWILFAMFLTGTASYFRPEITRWMQPELRPVGVSQHRATSNGFSICPMSARPRRGCSHGRGPIPIPRRLPRRAGRSSSSIPRVAYRSPRATRAAASISTASISSCRSPIPGGAGWLACAPSSCSRRSSRASSRTSASSPISSPCVGARVSAAGSTRIMSQPCWPCLITQ